MPYNQTCESRTRYGPRTCKRVMRALTPLFVMSMMLQSPAAYAAQSLPEMFVQQNVDKGLIILNNNTLAPRERDSEIRALLLSITDVKRLALFTLGANAPGASNSQRDDFVSAFSGLFAVVFQHDLEHATGEAIVVTGSQIRAPDDVIVNATITGAGSMLSSTVPVKIAFRVRKNAGGADVIVDLQVEGIWMALTQRDEFAAYLGQHGSNINLLTAELASRADAPACRQYRHVSGNSKPTVDRRLEYGVTLSSHTRLLERRCCCSRSGVGDRCESG